VQVEAGLSEQRDAQDRQPARPAPACCCEAAHPSRCQAGTYGASTPYCGRKEGPAAPWRPSCRSAGSAAPLEEAPFGRILW